MHNAIDRPQATASAADNHGMRDILLRNSARLFAVHGYQAAKISDIVRASGVSQAAFYWHFASKLEVALEIITTGGTHMLQVIRRGFRQDAVSASDMQDNTEQWLLQLLDFAQSNRYFIAILLSRLKGASEDIQQAITDTRNNLLYALRDNIRQAVAVGTLQDNMPLELRAAFVYRLIEGSIEWWLFGADHDLDHVPAVSTRELAAQLACFEFGGLLGVCR